MQRNKMYIKPIYWGDPDSDNSCYLFGITSNNKTIYLKILMRYAYKITFNKDVNEGNLTSILTLDHVKIIERTKRNIIIRTSELIDPDKIPGTIMRLEQSTLMLFNFIRPYDWMCVNEAFEFINKYTRCYYEMYAHEQYISIPDKIDVCLDEKYIFWSVSSYNLSNKLMTSSMNATIPSRSLRKDERGSDRNILGSTPRDSPKDLIRFCEDVKNIIYSLYIIVYNNHNMMSYVITDRDIESTEVMNVKYIRVKSEEEIITWFFDIISLTLPDFLISFNSDHKLIPLIIERTISNECYSSTDFKVLGEPIDIYNRTSNIDRIGSFKKNCMEIHGVNNIDMYKYTNKFIPHMFDNISIDSLENNKNIFHDLVTSKYISIDNKIMKEYPVNSNEDKMIKNNINQVLSENYQILYHLAEYVVRNNVINKMLMSCNNLGISFNTLLHNSSEDISSHVCNPYSLDVKKKRKRTFKVYKKGKPGVYVGCQMYFFHKLYQNVMETSDSRSISDLGKKVRDAPPFVILSVYFSEYINRSSLKGKVMSELNGIINSKDVLYVGKYYIISYTKLDVKKTWLEKVNKTITYTQ